MGSELLEVLGSWSQRLGWPLMVAAAILVYELTAEPALGAVTACLKLGWDDFLTAVWLAKSDPLRGRRMACFWFYTAAGLWRISLASAGALVALGVASGWVGGPQGPAGNWAAVVMATAMEALAACLLSPLVTLVAVSLALRHGVKVWVDSAVHQSRRQRQWPPLHWRKNRARVPVLISLVLLATLLELSLVLLTGAALAHWFGFGGGQQFGPAGTLFCIFMVVSLIVVAFVALAVCDVVVHRTVARVPWQCWPEIGGR